MESWSRWMREKPKNLNTFVAKEIDGLKKKMAPLYFDHDSSDIQNGPYLWFDDITLAYKNILAGNDLRETRSILTGLSTSVDDATFLRTVATSMISVTRSMNLPTLKKHKYKAFESAMEKLNSTSCLNMAICHQTRIKVGKFREIRMGERFLFYDIGIWESIIYPA